VAAKHTIRREQGPDDVGVNEEIEVFLNKKSLG